MPKKIVVKIGGSSSDQLDLQSLNDFSFFKDDLLL